MGTVPWNESFSQVLVTAMNSLPKLSPPHIRSDCRSKTKSRLVITPFLSVLLIHQRQLRRQLEDTVTVLTST
jgi:hypothetical protein